MAFGGPQVGTAANGGTLLKLAHQEQYGGSGCLSLDVDALCPNKNDPVAIYEKAVEPITPINGLVGFDCVPGQAVVGPAEGPVGL